MKLILTLMLLLNLAVAQKLALVIGNSDYNRGYLPNPTKDANLIAQKLEDVGFKVTTVNNISTATEMKKVINNFARKLNRDDIAVVYYAGHGVQCLGKNYLMPTKANVVKGGQLASEAVDLNFLIGGLSEIKLAIVMLDACRNNTYPSCSKSQTRGLVQPTVANDGGMIISFATAENDIALDGNKEHSPYALALSKFMNQSLPIETYFREVGGEVFSSSGQRPMLKNSFYGKFSFAGDVPPALLPTPKLTSKWITPKDNVCKANGGRIYKMDNTCISHGRESELICKESDGRLPTKSELQAIVINCGGILNKDKWSKESKRNIKNKKYQHCYKEKGFSSNLGYWSSNNKNDRGYYLRYLIDLETGVGNMYGADKSNASVRCIKR